MTADRLQAALEALVLKNLPELRFLGTWDYKVEVAIPGPPVTVEATCTDGSMPPISGVPVRPGPDGGYAVPSPGDVVCVAFANPLNPQLRRPYIVSLDPSNIPLKATLDAKGEVDIGASALLTKIGAAAAPVALAAGVETCIGTIATALGSVGAMLTASPAPPATNFTTFAAAAGPILTGITGALAPELLLVPTKTTTAT